MNRRHHSDISPHIVEHWEFKIRRNWISPFSTYRATFIVFLRWLRRWESRAIFTVTLRLNVRMTSDRKITSRIARQSHSRKLIEVQTYCSIRKLVLNGNIPVKSCSWDRRIDSEMIELSMGREKEKNEKKKGT